MPTRVIFKFDDFTGMTRRVVWLDRIVRLLKVKITWGIIGNRVDKWSDGVVAWVKDRANGGLYFFWNHGWTHAIEEFGELSVEEAKEHLRKTQDAVKAKAGLILGVFGAPCNKISDSTLQAIEALPEITGWYFGDIRSKKKVFKREFELEYPLPRPRLLPFIKNFQKIARVENRERTFVLQGHPNQWQVVDFLNFICIVVFLKLQNITFAFPIMEDSRV